MLAQDDVRYEMALTITYDGEDKENDEVIELGKSEHQNELSADEFAGRIHASFTEIQKKIEETAANHQNPCKQMAFGFEIKKGNHSKYTDGMGIENKSLNDLLVELPRHYNREKVRDALR